MRRVSLAILLLGLLCRASLSAASSDRLSFSNLAFGDTIVVNYRTQGCGGGYEMALIFEQRENLTVAFQEMDTWPRNAHRKRKPWPNRDWSQMPTLNLSQAEIDGLDRLLDFYRPVKRGFCTTVEYSSLFHQRDGKTIGIEEFVDDSCSIDRMTNLTTFGMLIDKSFSKQSPIFQSNPYESVSILTMSLLGVSIIFFLVNLCSHFIDKKAT